MANPTLADFKNLALLLPSSEKAASGEVGDVASAVAAYIGYGDGILQAAEKGAQGVADFFHDHLTQKAADNGDPAPVKGAPVVNTQTKPGQPSLGQVTQSDLSTLKADILGELRNILGELTGAGKAGEAAAEAPPAAPAQTGPPVVPPAPPASDVTAGDDGTGTAA